MRTCDWEPKDFAKVTMVTPGFAQQVKNLKGNDGYGDLSDIEFAIGISQNKTEIENINLIAIAETKQLITY